MKLKNNRANGLRKIGRLMIGLLAATGVASGAEAREPSPVNVGDRRQVFIDRTFLAESKRVELVVHPPRKTGEMTIRCDRPWEKGGIGPYSSVLKDGDTYHMWYHAMDTTQWDRGEHNGAMCYARSKDGIHWEKPELGITAYQGDARNNIVIGHGAAGIQIDQDGGMVFVDPNAPAEERFRMAARFGVPMKEGAAIHIYSSGDGMHWKLTHKSVIVSRPQEKVHHLDSQNVIFWDAQRGKYVAYVRKNRVEPGSQGRTIARGESEKLGEFPAVQDMPIVFGPDADDLHFGRTPLVDFYMSAAIKYPLADNAYYLFPTAYCHYIPGMLAEFERDLPTNAGPLDTQFAASRDGINWERYDRRPFVPLGMKGEFDWASARVIRGLVPDTTGREMYLYYRASDWLHGWDRDERNKRLLTEAGLGADQNIAVISRLVSRRDGFVSVRGAYTGGTFTTPPLVFKGRELVLNVDTSAAGLVRVGILDEAGAELEGFAARDADVIHTCNEINRVVRWRRSSDVSRWAGRAVRLQFSLVNADVYAFEFRE